MVNETSKWNIGRSLPCNKHPSKPFLQKNSFTDRLIATYTKKVNDLTWIDLNTRCYPIIFEIGPLVIYQSWCILFYRENEMWYIWDQLEWYYKTLKINWKIVIRKPVFVGLSSSTTSFSATGVSLSSTRPRSLAGTSAAGTLRRCAPSQSSTRPFPSSAFPSTARTQSGSSTTKSSSRLVYRDLSWCNRLPTMVLSAHILCLSQVVTAPLA